MWQCKKCNEKLEDSFDSCWSCGYEKPGSEIISESFNEEKDEEKDEIKNEIKSHSVSLLSDKFKTLQLFQSILWIALVIHIGGLLYAILDSLDFNDDVVSLMPDIPAWIPMMSISSYVLLIVSSYCTIKIIDFLFELDKQSN